MKKSGGITLGLLLTACGCLISTSSCSEPKRCVDENGVVVEDSKCDEEDKAMGTADSNSSGYRPMHHWYYGGYGAAIGSRAFGGGLTPKAGTSYSSPRASRGGFGGSASSHGISGS